MRYRVVKYLQKKVDKLRRQAEQQFKSIPNSTNNAKGTMCNEDQVYVNYFALIDLIRYYDQTQQAARVVIELREKVNKLYFGLRVEE